MSAIPAAVSECKTQQHQQQEFDDKIHQLVNSARRPSKTDENELALLESLLECLIELCGTDSNRWKTLILAITHKRYHLKSPQAKQDSTNDAGDGERLIFYTAVSTFFKNVQQASSTNILQAKLALDCLVKIAPLAGGSRDVCTILTSMVSKLVLQDEGMKQARAVMMEMNGSASLSPLVGCGVRIIQHKLQQQDESTRHVSSLKFLLDLAADTLDNDLDIIQNYSEHDKEQHELPSTLHVFLPHRDRGRPSNKKKAKQVSDRQVVNSIAEILIWSRTTHAMNNQTFMDCYESFLANRNDTKSNLFILQTVIRSLRKQLNGFARSQGFMLSNQFQLVNGESLTMKQVARGKAGDLSILTRLAVKKKDDVVLEMIRARSEFGKTDKYSSVNELIEFAVKANASPEQLQRLHISRVKGTLEHVRALVKTCEKSVMISSMENSKSNHVTAILVAAAMSKWNVLTDEEMEDTMKVELEATSSGTTVKLFIGGVHTEMSSFQDFLALLNDAALGLVKNESDAPSFMNQDGIATTKAVMNVIDRHLQDSEALLLITSADIHLPFDIVKSLTTRGCTVHCHDSDGIGKRLLRESAQKGDITISLAWDTTDDLDLHVILPNEEEISFSHKTSTSFPCMLDVDMNVGGESKEPVENVFAGNLEKMVEAPQGHYTVIVQNYAYHERGASRENLAIPFRVVIETNGVKETFHGQCQGTGPRSNVKVHEFNYQGRTVPFPAEEKLITAFSTSNMVNLTASTGQTLESLGRLVKTVQELEHLDAVRMLLDERENVDESTLERPLTAQHGTLEVTSRDRTTMLLARLPLRFHMIVGEAFGGPSLVETCAMDISRQMVAENIPISELKRNGYPDGIVEAVKSQMAKTEPVF